ncbi:MAG: Potassium channel [Alyxoria varia]|nr:MAG: Potassium channel [Alyxoria varia]
MSGPTPGTLDGLDPDDGPETESNGDVGFDGTAEDEEKKYLDPRLLAVNGVSLGFAILANASLLANMSGQARFEATQSISITSFLVASVLLIALIAKASQPSFLGSSGRFAVTQAYYYAIWAAGTYFIVTMLLLLTVYGAVRGKYAKKFDLTVPQRTLMLQTIAFLVYLLIGALIFSNTEDWKYLDAVYWANFTLLTVGLGSPFTPSTHLGRSLLLFYAVGGIVTLGLVVGSIRSMLVETGKSKLRARAIEKARQKVHSYRDAYHGSLGGFLQSKNRKAMPSTERDRRRLEFHGMRHIQDSSSQRSQWNSLIFSTLAASLLWFIGALVFMHTESQQDWSYFVALYFSYTSLLTMGYGDYQPYSNAGKAFYVLWSLLAVPTLTVLISDMSDTVVKMIADFTNWLGSLTILPEYGGILRSWKEALNGVSGRKSVQPEEAESVGSSAASGTARRYDPEDATEHERSRTASETARDNPEGASRHCNIVRMVTRRLNAEELFAWQQHYKNLGGEGARAHDAHFYRWLLIKEIKNVVADSDASEAKKYTYEEWSYFLLLIGHDEQNPRIHRRPNASSDSGTGSGDGPILGQIMDPDGNPYPWSWMGIRSPLMCPKDETDWILHHLILTLQRQLSLNIVSNSEKRDLPTDLPVSMSMMQAINVLASVITGYVVLSTHTPDERAVIEFQEPWFTLQTANDITAAEGPPVSDTTISTSRGRSAILNDTPPLTGNAPTRTINVPSRTQDGASAETSASTAAGGQRAINILLGVCGGIILFVAVCIVLWFFRRRRMVREHPEWFWEPPRFPMVRRLRYGERAMPLPRETTYSERLPQDSQAASGSARPRMFLPRDPLNLLKLSPAELLRPEHSKRSSKAESSQQDDTQKEGEEIELQTFLREDAPRAGVKDNRLDTVVEDPASPREKAATTEAEAEAGPSTPRPAPSTSQPAPSISRSLSLNDRSPSRRQGARHSFRPRAHRFGAPVADPRPPRPRFRQQPVPQPPPEVRVPPPASSVYTPPMRPADEYREFPRPSWVPPTRPSSQFLDSRRPSFIPDTRPTSEVPSEFSETLRLAFGDVDPRAREVPSGRDVRSPPESGLLPPPLNVRNRLSRSESDPEMGSISQRVSGEGSQWGEIPIFFARDLGSAANVRWRHPDFSEDPEEYATPGASMPQEEAVEGGEGEEGDQTRQDKGKGRVYETEEGEVIGLEMKRKK